MHYHPPAVRAFLIVLREKPIYKKRHATIKERENLLVPTNDSPSKKKKQARNIGL